MIVLRSLTDIPNKIIELTLIHPSKDSALLAVDAEIARLVKIQNYRYYLEHDLETGHALVMYRRLRRDLENIDDWYLPEIIEPTALNKINTLILNQFNKISKYLINIIK